MANVLEFAFALQDGPFLASLSRAMGGLLMFEGIGESLRFTLERTWSAVERGAELQGLANRTNTAVNSLYQFQQGLMAIGAPAENIQMLMLMTQKALSGVNDAGFRTDILFSRIGLNMADLRHGDTISAIQQIALALSHLSGNQASGVAEELFGRFNAGTIIGLAHNMETFQRGFSLSSQTGALLDKFSKTFEEVKLDWQIIENDVQGIWVAIAGSIAPELHKIFSEGHDSIKNIGLALSGAFTEGRVGELLSDTISAAFEQAGYYGEHVFSALALGFGDALLSVITIVFTDMIPHGLSKLKNEIESADLYNSLQKAQREQDMYTDEYNKSQYPDEKKEALAGSKAAAADVAKFTNQIKALSDLNDADFSVKFRDAIQKADAGFQGALGDMTKTLAALGPYMGPATHALALLVKDLAGAGAAGSRLGANSTQKQSPADIALSGGNFHPEFTALEKMGFIMFGGGRVQNPYDIRKVDLLQSIDNGIKKIAHIEPIPYMERSDINQL